MPADDRDRALVAGLSPAMRTALSLGRRRRLTPRDARWGTIAALEARGLVEVVRPYGRWSARDGRSDGTARLTGDGQRAAAVLAGEQGDADGR